ncbi:MAG: hypothetical protein WBZ42_02235 [Halobacteriota archaeon]
MKRVGKSKVTKLKAKADIVYPLIRLPKTYADEIGQVAEIFEPWRNNKRALFIVFDEAAVPPKIIQPSAKAIQLDSSKRIKNRLQELESEIKELYSIIFSNERDSLHENKNQWAQPDSNRRPPPCEGDVIKTFTTKC